MGYFEHSIAVVVAIILYKCYTLTDSPPLPTLEKNPWWGPEESGVDATVIKPFQINVSKEDIEDLNLRLSLPLRLSPPLQNANFSYGFNSDVMKEISEYWKMNYNWKKREKKLNSLPQYITQIEGLNIHFMHIKPNVSSSSGPVLVRPLMLIHGWPGSVFELDEILPHLTLPREDRKFVFEVVCPSIPGYAFSQASSKQGLGPLQTAQIFLKLMKRLGFEQYYVQGGDFGSLIASYMSTLFPENILGVHTNLITIYTPGTIVKHIIGSFLPSVFIMTREDEKYMYPMGEPFHNLLKESGYIHLQATKPDTIGAALSESPIGLAAYILEKYSSLTNRENPLKPDGGLLSEDFPISLDRLLDNLSIYWFTRSITTSMRFFAEGIDIPRMVRLDMTSTQVPSGFSAFEHEIVNLPVSFASHKFGRIVLFRRHMVGGQFAAMEQPTLLSKDIHDFVEKVESIEKLEDVLFTMDKVYKALHNVYSFSF